MAGIAATSKFSQSARQPTTGYRQYEFKGKKLAYHYYEFNKEDYNAFLGSGFPVVLFFYGKECESCREQENILIELTEEGMTEDVYVLKLYLDDPDRHPEDKKTADYFSVTTPNTFVVLGEDTTEIKRSEGLINKEELNNLLSRV